VIQAAATPLASGDARLHVAQIDGASTVLSAAARNPSRWLLPRCRGPAVWACLGGFGGGLVSGDHVAVEVVLDRGARAFIGTQASTKVYRADDRRRARQDWRVRLADEACLIALPDPLTCFAHADYRQHQHLQLAAGASLVWLDWCSDGRHHNAERWAFTRYDATLALERDGERLLTDGLLLEADAAAPLTARLNDQAVIASAVVLGPQVAALAADLRRAVHADPSPPGVRWACSPLAEDGVLVRLIAESVADATRVLRRHLAVAALLGDHPWERK